MNNNNSSQDSTQIHHHHLPMVDNNSMDMSQQQQQQHMFSTPSTPVDKPTEVDKEREMAELLITMDSYKSIVK